MIVRKRSCPAVSQICSLIFLPSSSTFCGADGRSAEAYVPPLDGGDWRSVRAFGEFCAAAAVAPDVLVNNGRVHDYLFKTNYRYCLKKFAYEYA